MSVTAPQHGAMPEKHRRRISTADRYDRAPAGEPGRGTMDLRLDQLRDASVAFQVADGRMTASALAASGL